MIEKIEESVFLQITDIIETAKNNAHKKVNEELINMYWKVDKNDEVVEYAMSRSMSPMLVAEYQLQLPDKSILEKKLQELTRVSGLQNKKEMSILV